VSPIRCASATLDWENLAGICHCIQTAILEDISLKLDNWSPSIGTPATSHSAFHCVSATVFGRSAGKFAPSLLFGSLSLGRHFGSVTIGCAFGSVSKCDAESLGALVSLLESTSECYRSLGGIAVQQLERAVLACSLASISSGDTFSGALQSHLRQCFKNGS
jgi:hypothetical protein